jgi:tight adherence protein B
VDELSIIYGFVLAAVILAVLGLLSFIARARGTKETIKRRLAVSADPAANSEPFDVLRQGRGLTSFDDNLRFAQLNDFLIQTGLKLSKLALGLSALLLCVAITATLSAIVSHVWLAAAAGLLIGPSLVVLYLALARRRRIERFASQLPDALNVIVRSLRVGHPLVSAMELVSREMPDPLGAELGITAEEIAFGQDVTTAVSNLHRRVGQNDLLFLVLAVSVQSQTGGNLADVLARLATLMRQRVMLRLKVKALSAEGRLSAWFLSAMPFVLYGAVRGLSHDYFGVLEGSPVLAPALIYGWTSLVVANIVIYRMVNFKI